MKDSNINNNMLRYIHLNNNKLEKHIDYCQHMLGICNRKSNKLKPYYFKKQIEITRKKLLTFY